MTTTNNRQTKIFSVLLPKMVSKSNYRRGDSSKWRRNVAFERECSLLLKSSMPESWTLGSPLDPLVDRPRVVVAIAAVTLLDAGNISKSLLDAAEGVLYLNDASVWAVTQVVSRKRANQKTAACFIHVPAGVDLDVVELLSAASREALDLLEKTDTPV
jgi:hypothetical protein